MITDTMPVPPTPAVYRPALPVATAVSPSPAAAGTPITITGGGFAAAAQVLFGDTPAAFVVDGDGTISAVVPAGPTGTVEVRVLNAAGRTTTAPLLFTYTAEPASALPTAPLPAVAPIACGRVPSLLGYTLAAAVRVLDRDNCRVRLTHTGRAKRAPGRIVRQSVKPGTPLDAGATLRVTVG